MSAEHAVAIDLSELKAIKLQCPQCRAVSRFRLHASRLSPSLRPVLVAVQNGAEARTRSKYRSTTSFTHSTRGDE